MSKKIRDIVNFFEEIAPSRLAEEWDNVGLLLGSMNMEVNKIMVSLDITEEVVNEAVEKKVDMIVSHHPLIFKGIKRICEDDARGKLLYKLIRNNICVFCLHTNLDAAEEGTNDYLAGLLGLKDVRNLRKYKAERLYKVVVFVPQESIEIVREAMNRAGAGWIGNYSDCSFFTKGTGTFKPLENTNPYIGIRGNLEKVDEYRLETIVSEKDLHRVVDSMISAHPYEEVAYDIYKLEQETKVYGIGKAGTLAKPMMMDEFISMVKNVLNAGYVKVIGKAEKEIESAAVFCGSYDGDLGALKSAGVDVLVTGDIKYHTALDVIENGMCIIDAGHFETEMVMVPKIAEMIKEKFAEIEILITNAQKNPFTYC